MKKETVSKKVLSPKKSAPIAKAKSRPAKAVSKSVKSNSAKAAPGTAELLEAFFCEELKDIYWAEKHLIKALTKMEKNATAPKLKQAFADHRKVTQGHIERLETVFALVGKKPVAKKCEAMAGITKEGDDIIEETEKGTETRDVGLILAAQKVEHYEIATYGGLAELARTLDKQKVADILEKTLSEEKEADASLTQLAKRNINRQASEETDGKQVGFFEKVKEMLS